MARASPPVSIRGILPRQRNLRRGLSQCRSTGAGRSGYPRAGRPCHSRYTRRVVQPDNEKSYRGKWFVFVLFFGFVAFAFACGFGTYFLANSMTPALRARSEEAIKRAKEQEKKVEVP